MGVGQGQVNEERLVIIIIENEFSRPEDPSPVNVPVDGILTAIQSAGIKTVVGVAARISPPGMIGMESGPGHMPPALEIFSPGREMGMAIFFIAELSRHKVVPAAPPDIITSVFEYSLEVRFAPVVMQHMIHGPMTPNMGIPAGHETAAGGCTDRVLAKGPGKRYGVCLDEAVQIGSRTGSISQMTQRIGPHLVRIKKQNVRLFIQAITPPLSKIKWCRSEYPVFFLNGKFLQEQTTMASHSVSEESACQFYCLLVIYTGTYKFYFIIYVNNDFVFFSYVITLSYLRLKVRENSFFVHEREYRRSVMAGNGR